MRALQLIYYLKEFVDKVGDFQVRVKTGMDEDELELDPLQFEVEDDVLYLQGDLHEACSKDEDMT